MGPPAAYPGDWATGGGDCSIGGYVAAAVVGAMAPALFFLLRRIMNQIPKATRAKTATPPTAPPTIAPILVDEPPPLPLPLEVLLPDDPPDDEFPEEPGPVDDDESLVDLVDELELPLLPTVLVVRGVEDRVTTSSE
jgi:hypothetical protein